MFKKVYVDNFIKDVLRNKIVYRLKIKNVNIIILLKKLGV